MKERSQGKNDLRIEGGVERQCYCFPLDRETKSYKSKLECIVNAERKECKNQKICLNRMTQQAITEMVPGLCRS